METETKVSLFNRVNVGIVLKTIAITLLGLGIIGIAVWGYNQYTEYKTIEVSVNNEANVLNQLISILAQDHVVTIATSTSN